jgi:NitT/TauT family transport system substrate-binding protein
MVLATSGFLLLAAPGGEASADRLSIGYFPNVNHAPALVSLERGLFGDALAAADPGSIELRAFAFNSGTEATEALFAGAIDIAFVGANPALNAFARSNGEAITIIAGSTSGGAYLVVRDGIDDAADLRGATLATPALGNTQDVALRSWLTDQGLRTRLDGGGDVSVMPQSNATTFEAFVSGALDGAWVPEPWATRLVRDGGGHVLVDERDLWPEGRYPTAVVVVRSEYLQQHPQVVSAFLGALLDSIEVIESDPSGARAAVVAQLDALTGRANDPSLVDASMDRLTFSVDPVASAMRRSADNAIALGLLDDVDFTGIYDLSLLNELLAQRGLEPVADEATLEES